MTGSDAAFLEDMPTLLRTHLDFINNFLIVLLSFGLRAGGLLKERHIAGMQFVTFMLCLPALSLVVAWSAHIDRSIVVVLAISALTHTLWVSLVVFVLGITNAKQKGMYFMSTTASAMAFVYPVVLQSDRFGTNSAAIILLWDFGGNLAVCWLLQGIAARRYAPGLMEEVEDVDPKKCAAASAALESAADRGDPELAASTFGRAVDAEVDARRTQDPEAGTQFDPEAGNKFEEKISDVTTHATETTRATDAVTAVPSDFAETSMVLTYLKYAGMGLRNPVLLAAGVGLLLNMARVPMYPVPARAAQSLMGAFPPLLYAFVGANLRFNLGRDSYSFIAKALFTRWTVCVAVALAGRALWPVDEKTAGVLTLCMAAPATAALMMWASHFSYRLDQASMVWNVSAVTSLIVMSLIAPIV